MNGEEFTAIIAKLQMAYQRGLDKGTLKIYWENLEREDASATLEAVDRWIKRDPRFPRVSELLDEIHPKQEWIFPEEDLPALEFKDLAGAAKSETAKEACQIIFGLCDKTMTKMEAARKMMVLHEKNPHVSPSWRLCAELLLLGKRMV